MASFQPVRVGRDLKNSFSFMKGGCLCTASPAEVRLLFGNRTILLSDGAQQKNTSLIQDTMMEMLRPLEDAGLQVLRGKEWEGLYGVAFKLTCPTAAAYMAGRTCRV